jgi:cyanate lyase
VPAIPDILLTLRTLNLQNNITLGPGISATALLNLAFRTLTLCVTTTALVNMANTGRIATLDVGAISPIPLPPKLPNNANISC